MISITNVCGSHNHFDIIIACKNSPPGTTSFNIECNRETLINKVYKDTDLICELQEFFNNDDLKIGSLYVGGHTNIYSILSDTLTNLKLQVNHIYFEASCEILNDDHLKVLELCDPEVLESITIRAYLFRKQRDEVFRKLTETMQWKRAKKLCLIELPGNPATPMEVFLHFENLQIQEFNQILKAEDAWDLIKSFKNRDLPIGSNFSLRNCDLDAEKIIWHFNVPKKCEPLEGVHTRAKHVQRFDLPSEDKVLEVALYDNKIEGSVLTKNSKRVTTKYL